MTRTTIERTIGAPVPEVFRTVSDIRRFSEAIPDIVDVEILSETTSGVGTRFRETREVNGRTATVELEVAEFVEDDRIRLVSDAHGTVWDTVFTVLPTAEGKTRLTMVMDARPHRLLSRILVPLTRGVVKKAIEKDMDRVKAFCEG